MNIKSIKSIAALGLVAVALAVGREGIGLRARPDPWGWGG